MVHANNKYAYPNIHILFMSLSCHFHKVNMFSDIIVLDPSTTFQIYDLILCDTSCNHSHMPLYYSRKRKRNEKEN